MIEEHLGCSVRWQRRQVKVPFELEIWIRIWVWDLGADRLDWQAVRRRIFYDSEVKLRAQPNSKEEHVIGLLYSINPSLW